MEIQKTFERKRLVVQLDLNGGAEAYLEEGFDVFRNADGAEEARKPATRRMQMEEVAEFFGVNEAAQAEKIIALQAQLQELEASSKARIDELGHQLAEGAQAFQRLHQEAEKRIAQGQQAAANLQRIAQLCGAIAAPSPQ